MKKLLTTLLFFLLFTLAACNSKDNNPSISGDTTGISENITVTPTPVPPTPTPEGNYVGFSLDSGFYDKTQKVSLSCNVEGAEIYYTLDGSTPTKDSKLYKGEITVSRKLYTQNVLAAQKNTSAGNKYIPDYSVDKGTVIRAIAYLPDGTTTPIAHATYFIALDREKYGNVPVISLITDFDNLYDYETGIYVLGKTHDDWLAEDPANASLEGWQMVGNYSNRGREWERPVSVELLTADGTQGFKQNMGVRIMGGASRNQTQKTLKFYAREEYEAKNLKYELIPENYNTDGELIAKYKTFILRVGGNDADYARLRDPFLQALVKDANFETQQSTPCVVFLNGEYWGMYAITEDYTDNHFENNYGIDNNNIVLVKRGELEEGEEGDLALYESMYNFIVNNDMSDAKQYKAACEMVDMTSFIDYFAFQLYIHNEDGIFENNNWRLWRVRTADGATAYSDEKWRFAVYDTDFSTGIYNGPESYSTDNISPVIAPSSEEDRENNLANHVPIELFRSLLNSDEFQSELILALCDMRNIYFEPNRASRLLNEMLETYQLLVPDTLKRFGPDWIANQDTAAYYEGKVTDLRIYINKRYNAFPNIIKNAFGLSSMKKLNVSINDTGMGTVQINGRTVDFTLAFTGMYFPENTVTLTAIPSEGYKFVRWEVTSGELSDTTSQTIRFSMESGINVTAVFETQ